MSSSIDPRRLYIADPVQGASSAFAVLFAIAFSLHVYQNTKYKCWGLNWLNPVNAIIFIAGFVCLEYNAFHPTANAPSQGLMYSGAAILEASLFCFLAYLIAVQRDIESWWTKVVGTMFILILSAVISLTAQGTANFFSTGADPSTAQADLQVLRAGVTVLLAVNIVYFYFLVSFHRRSALGLLRSDTKREANIWVYVLYGAGILLLTRNLFRTVQIFSGAGQHVWTDEALFWVFDATPLLLCMLSLNFLPPVMMKHAPPVCAPSC